MIIPQFVCYKIPVLMLISKMFNVVGSHRYVVFCILLHFIECALGSQKFLMVSPVC